MKLLLTRIFLLIVLTIVAGFAQFFVVKKIGVNLFYSTFAIYSFHFLVTLVITVGLFFVNRKVNEYTGYGFLASSALRMLVSIVFLIPLIKAGVSNPMVDVLAFMIPYFIFLVFEVFWAVCLMNQKKPSMSD